MYKMMEWQRVLGVPHAPFAFLLGHPDYNFQLPLPLEGMGLWDRFLPCGMWVEMA